MGRTGRPTAAHHAAAVLQRPRRLTVAGIVLALICGLVVIQQQQPADAAASALAGKSVEVIATGASHTCAITTDGLLACWGLNSSGQLGDGTIINRNVPTPVALTGTVLEGKEIADVSAGTAHTCAVSTDGVLACWGLGGAGRLGTGNTTQQLVPAAVAVAGTPLDGKSIARVQLGGVHSCALATDQTLACWGNNNGGRLGDGTSTNRTTPRAVVVAGTPLASATIADLVGGGSHTCAVTGAGALACWGVNANGQLGDATTTNRNVPTAVAVGATVLDGLAIATVSAGTAHTCAASSTGVAACWGSQANGRLGNGLTAAASITTPVAVTTLGTPLAGQAVAQLTGGSTHTCARTASGVGACWGAGTNGRLGDGTTTTRSIPTALATVDTPLAGRTLVEVRVGTGHSCGVTDEQLAVCWGLNSSGQLGDGTLSQRTRAVAVITSPTISVAGIVGQRTGVLGYARAGDQVTIAGAWWSPNLASAAFSASVGGALATQTLTTDATGVITGSVTVPAEAAIGAGSLVITQGSDVVSIALTVLGPRAVAVAPQTGPAGTSVLVSGLGFDPTAELRIQGMVDVATDTSSTDAPVIAAASAVGSLTPTSYVINDASTTAVLVVETEPGGDPAVDRASAAFSVDPVTAAVAGITGQRNGVLNAARPGDTLALAGEAWPTNLAAGSFTVQLCDLVGAGCEAPLANDVASDGTGSLAGSVTIPIGATTGDRTVRISDGVRAALAPLVILGERVVTVVPLTGGAGTTVSVVASAFDPLADVTIQGVRSTVTAESSADDPLPAVTTTAGALAATDYTITDPLTTAVMVVENAPEGDPAADRAFGAFTVLPVDATIVSIQGQRPGVVSHARGGDILAVTGTAWAPELVAADLSAALCVDDGSLCGDPLTQTLLTDAGGVLSGTIDIPGDAITGDRSLRIASANGEVLLGLTVLGLRSVVLSTTTIVVGSSVTVTGLEFDPEAGVTVQGATAAAPGLVTPTADPPVSLIADSTGEVGPVAYPVNDPATAFVVVSESAPGGDPLQDLAFIAVTTETPVFALGLTTLAADSNPDASTILLPTLTTPITPTTVQADLNPVVVVDTRGGEFGWSLTASVTDFVGTSGATIDQGQLSIAAACTSTPGSAPGFAPGDPIQSFAGPVYLCTKDESLGIEGTTDGVYTAGGQLTLLLPAFQAADLYTATLTVTLA